MTKRVQKRNIGAGAVERMGIPSETVQRFFRIVLLTLSSQLQSRRKTKPEPGWDVHGSCVEQIVPFGYCRSDYCRRKSGCPHRYRGHVVLLQVGLVQPVKSHLGPLKETNTLVIGVGNVPVELKGITDSLKLEWDSIVDHCEIDGSHHT